MYGWTDCHSKQFLLRYLQCLYPMLIILEPGKGCDAVSTLFLKALAALRYVPSHALSRSSQHYFYTLLATDSRHCMHFHICRCMPLVCGPNLETDFTFSGNFWMARVFFEHAVVCVVHTPLAHFTYAIFMRRCNCLRLQDTWNKFPL